MMRYLALLAFLLLPLTVHADAWPDNTIGAGIGVAAKPERTGFYELEKIANAGFTFVRFDMRWFEVEHQRGEYNWSAFDRFIGDMRENHLKSMIILDDSNGLYSEKVDVDPKQSYGFSWAYASPHSEESRRAFAAFAAAAVKRYGTKDIVWEIWNEPDSMAFWAPKPNPEDFVLLAGETCQAMRKVDPHAVIVGPAIARLPSRIDFLHQHFFEVFIKSHVKDCLNAVSVHPYRSHKAPETVIDDYNKKVRPFIATFTEKDKKPLPVIDSEWGYSTTDVTPEQQAAYVLRMHLSNLLAGVPISIIYEWQDSAHMSDEREMHFGMVSADRENKAGADIVEDLLPKIKNAKIIHRIPAGDDDAFVVLIRQPDGKNQLLAWMGVDKLDSPENLQVNDRISGRVSYPLTLVPQLISIGSSAPEIAVTKQAP